MEGKHGPGNLHGKILNAIFTMFKLSTCALGSVRPAAGQTRCNPSPGLAADCDRSRWLIGPKLRREQFSRLFAGHRFTEVPALADRAAKPHNRLERIFVLDPLDA